MKPYLSIIIPAYNEQDRLPETLQKLQKYLEKQDYKYEVLIINDGSKDQTVNNAQNAIKDWPEFKVLGYAENKGKGYAVRYGMLKAEGKWRLMMDADNSTDISELKKFWQEIELFEKKGVDHKLVEDVTDLKSLTSIGGADKFGVIIGSRYLHPDSIKVRQPLLRRLVSRFGNFLIRTYLGVKSVDTQCGFKLFSKEASEAIFPQQTINRWAFDVEILTIALHKGFQVKEIPVDWYNSAGSTVSKTQAIKTLKELHQIGKNRKKGLYSK